MIPIRGYSTARQQTLQVSGRSTIGLISCSGMKITSTSTRRWTRVCSRRLTSFLNPLFNAQSPQPSYEGQLSETHTFTPNLTNQFLFAASYSRAIFTNTNGTALGDSPTFRSFLSRPERRAAALSNEAGDCIRLLRLGSARKLFQLRWWTRCQLPTRPKRHGVPVQRRCTPGLTESTPGNLAGPSAATTSPTTHPARATSGSAVVRITCSIRAILLPATLINGRSGSRVILRNRSRCTWKVSTPRTNTSQFRTSPSHSDALEHDSDPLCRTNCVSNFSQDFSGLPTTQGYAVQPADLGGMSKGFFEEQTLGVAAAVWILVPCRSAPGSKTTIRGGVGIFNDYFPAQIMGCFDHERAELDPLQRARRRTWAERTLSRWIPSARIAVTQPPSHLTMLSKRCSPQGGYYRSASGACPDPLSIYCATDGVFTRPTIISVAHKVYSADLRRVEPGD